LATAIGRRVCIEVKPGWIEFPALYAAIVAEPGSAKSPAQDLATAPLRGEPNGLRSPSQLVVTDATVEALALALRQNPLGMLYEHDELSALTSGFNRYRRGVGSDRQFFQSAWSGKLVVINRIKVVEGERELDAMTVPNPFLCVVGGLPPDLLAELSDERGREDRFIHRFLFSFPDPIHPTYSDGGVSLLTREQYGDLVRAVFEHSQQPNPLRFGESAAARWRKQAIAHVAEMSTPGFPDYLRGPWRKLEAYAARL
jgi:hypothetical protein